jgi:hypothetical protein
LQGNGKRNLRMNNDEVAKILKGLSIPRVSVYTDLGLQPNSKELVDAYFALQEMSSHFFVPIQILEVCLRNSIYHALCRKFSENSRLWHEIIPISQEGRRILTLAKNKSAENSTRKRSNSYTQDDLVSNIMLGFWVHMLEPIHADPKNNPHHFWQSEIDNVFPGRGGKSLKSIFPELKRVNIYRNRLYHHEPVWKGKRAQSLNQAIESLEREYSKIFEVITWLSPEKVKYMNAVGYRTRFEECCQKYKK